MPRRLMVSMPEDDLNRNRCDLAKARAFKTSHRTEKKRWFVGLLRGRKCISIGICLGLTALGHILSQTLDGRKELQSGASLECLLFAKRSMFSA